MSKTDRSGETGITSRLRISAGGATARAAVPASRPFQAQVCDAVAGKRITETFPAISAAR